jgi:hypothetical protein
MSWRSRRRARRRSSYGGGGYRPAPPSIDPFELLQSLLESGGPRNASLLDQPVAPWRPPVASRPTWRWVPPGEAVTVAGYTIPGGMFYMGGGLKSLSPYGGPEPALIDPSLPVNRNKPDRSGAHAAYRPGYALLPPTSRAAYLEWLAGGRRAPAAPTPFLLLFFYGLERRLLTELGVGGESAEREALLAEIERLFKLYSADYQFRAHAQRLVDVVRAVATAAAPLGGPPPVSAPSPSNPYTYQSIYWSHELPLGLRLGLGRYAVEGRPLPADWALAWLRHDPSGRLRSPATRVPEEFGALFTRRYKERYGAGIELKPGRGVLSVYYYPASPSFGGAARLDTDIPEVLHQERALQKLQTIAERCADALEAFSRRRGYDLNQPPSLAMLAHLPAELLAERDDPALRQIMGVVARALHGGEAGEVDAARLIDRWPCATPGRLTRTEATGLADLLGKLGIGIEPDVRFGGPIPAAAGRAVLFRLPKGAPEMPSLGYTGDAALVQLAATVAAADGPPTAGQRDVVEAEVGRLPALQPAERVRLRMHARWALGAGLGLAGAKARAATIEAREPGPLARFLVRVAAADGSVSPAEIAMLRKLFAFFGLEPDDVYREVHALAVGTDEPVVVRPAGAVTPGYRIPPPRPREVRLDAGKIRRKQDETAAVSALLHEVFTEEEAPSAPVAAAAPPSTGETVAGLDVAHTALLRRMGESPHWSRAEAAALARGAGLLLDGALDAINDAAFDQIGAPVWEGDDPIEVDQAGVARLLALPT